ncbi:MAG: low molecular weight protein arginine phosphatase [Clostridia bacterium]|nr:low molecular weight protein arginine phosphatase [Clostridia bacterium]
MKVLFVCTGNTCRSPMAEGIFNSISKGAISRGISAEGGNASEKAIVTMEKMGIDISKHVSTQLSVEDINQSDLVLTMTKGHKNIILSVLPMCKDKVFTLGEYAGGSDVADPYGGSEAEYDKCARQLYEYIEKIVEKLK